MTIAELRAASKQVFARVPKDVLIVGIVVLAASGAFGLGIWADRETAQQGRESAKNGPKTQILGATATISPKTPETSLPATPSVLAPAKSQAVVASKTGTKYYLPSCSGVKRIKEANKVWFGSPAEARAKGYAPAATCKGL